MAESKQERESRMRRAIELLLLAALLLLLFRRWLIVTSARSLLLSLSDDASRIYFEEFAASAPLSDIARAADREAFQDAFEQRVREAASGFSTGALSPAEWFEQMTGAVTSHLLGQTMLGANRPLLPSELLALGEELEDEWSYLSSWGEEVFEAVKAGRQPSRASVEARGLLYAGRGRAAWFRADERGKAFGVVIDYLSVDDAGTCSPCLEAEEDSPYLPGSGPYPGEVCKGRGRCRCLRVPRDSFREFDRLTRERAGVRNFASEA